MFVALSKFKVANGMDQAVRDAFLARPHYVDSAPGFVRMEVIQPVEVAQEFWLITYWTKEAAFQHWHRSEAHQQSHRFIPKGLKLEKGSTEVRYFHHLCS